MEDQPVDITGTLHERNEGWEKRVEELCKPENFFVSIHPTSRLYDQLTLEERTRLQWKLELVSRYAHYMAAGMLKGTIKYPDDNLTMEQWLASHIGEGADKSNYDLLLFNAYYNGK